MLMKNLLSKQILSVLICSIFSFLIFPQHLTEAKVITQVDEFDNQTYVFSQFKDTELKAIKPLSELVLKKTYKATEAPKYLLLLSRHSTFSGVQGYSFYNDFKIKFDNNIEKTYSLIRYATHEDNQTMQMALEIPQNIIDMIMDHDSIQIESPLYHGVSGKMELDKMICTIPIEVINEWRLVITGKKL